MGRGGFHSRNPIGGWLRRVSAVLKKRQTNSNESKNSQRGTNAERRRRRASAPPACRDAAPSTTTAPSFWPLCGRNSFHGSAFSGCAFRMGFSLLLLPRSDAGESIMVGGGGGGGGGCLQAICKQHERILSLVVGEFATGLFYLRDNPGPSPDLYGRYSSIPQGNSSQGTLPGLVSKPLCSPEPSPRPDSARSTARPSRVGSPRVLGHRGNPRNNRFAPISTLSPRWRRGV